MPGLKIEIVKLLNTIILIFQVLDAQKKKKIKPKPKLKSKEKSNTSMNKIPGESKNQSIETPINKNIKNKISKKKKTIQKRRLKKTTIKEYKKVPIKKLKLTTQRPINNGSKENEIPDNLKWLQEDPHELLLSRFVETPKGTKLGESIGIDKSRLILKNKLKFYSIPMTSIKEKGDKLVLRRKVNWKLAVKLGERWRKKTLDVIKMVEPKKSRVIKVK
jgi:hypothetical protein